MFKYLHRLIVDLPMVMVTVEIVLLVVGMTICPGIGWMR